MRGSDGLLRKSMDKAVGTYLQRSYGSFEYDLAETTDPEVLKRAEETGKLKPVSMDDNGQFYTRDNDGNPILLIDREKMQQERWLVSEAAISDQARNDSFAIAEWRSFNDAEVMGYTQVPGEEPARHVGMREAALRWKEAHNGEGLDAALENGSLRIVNGVLLAGFNELRDQVRASRTGYAERGNPRVYDSEYTYSFIYNKQITGLPISAAKSGRIPIGTQGDYLQVDPMRLDPRNTLFFENKEQFMSADLHTYMLMWDSLSDPVKVRLRRDAPLGTQRPAEFMRTLQEYHAVKLWGQSLK